MSSCRDDKEAIMLLGDIYGNNASRRNYERASLGQGNISCNFSDTLDDSVLNKYAQYIDMFGGDVVPPNQIAINFYAYITPLIIMIGLFGNIASLFVFTSRRLRGLSASHYLAALSGSDTIVLLTYVFLGWLSKGLPHWPGSHQVSVINVNGVCHLFLYFSYTFRFISVYLVIVFTIERYVAVCKPLKRRIICTRHFARKLIVMVFTLGFAISIYKPILSGIYDPRAGNARDDDINIQNVPLKQHRNASSKHTLTSEPIVSDKVCMRNQEYDEINFIMEVMYGSLITVIPFILMLVFNILIIHRLVVRFADHAQVPVRSSARENRIRWEFTVMLLAVSTCFIALNIPYNIVWIKQFFTSINPKDFQIIQKLRSQIHITRTVFTLNYCINFFVYCLTGSYYRSVVTDWLRCNKDASKQNNGYHVVRINSMSTQGTVI